MIISTRTSLILSLVLLTLSNAAQAFISPPNYRDPSYNYGTWSNTGDIRIVPPARCVMSTDGRNRRSGNPTNFTLTASMTTGVGTFELTQLGGDGSGVETIPFNLEYEWYDDSSSTNETLADGVPSNQHLGGIRVGNTPCSINGVQVDNSRLIVHINEAALLAAENGDYEGTLEVTHTGGVAMGESRTRRNVSISLTKNATMIQILNLDLVDLGSWDGAAAFMSDAEGYCAYTSTGNYRVTASSLTQGSGGAGTFGIEHAVLAGVKIDYDLYLDDDNDAQVGGTQIANGGTISGFTGATSVALCSTLDNASLYVTTTSNLGAAVAGIYTSQLTLTLEPE